MSDTPKLTAYDIHPNDVEIRPGSPRRDWMDATRQKFAYRCLPLTIANSHGWDVIGDTTFRAVWNGRQGLDSVRFDIKEKGKILPASHFGEGVITFSFPILFRSEAKMGLWVSGPPNTVKQGIAPLSGIVETDWAPMSFTMNWKITQPHIPVSFRAGEPICFFFPLDRTLVNRIEPERRPLTDNMDLARLNAQWAKDRLAFNADTKIEGSEARERGWQKDYHKGRYPPDAEPAPDHLSKINAREFGPPKDG